MARLQPMPASHELLAPFDVAIRALRPNWAKPDPEMRKELLRLGWKVLEEKGSSSQEGIWRKLQATMAERGGVVDPKQSELSRGIFDELPPWKVWLSSRYCRKKTKKIKLGSESIFSAQLLLRIYRAHQRY